MKPGHHAKILTAMIGLGLAARGLLVNDIDRKLGTSGHAGRVPR